MSSPSRRISPKVGSMRRVKQRISVDLPLPDRPITTKISPGATSNETSRTAIVEPVRSRKSWLDSSVGGDTSLPSAGPKIFQRLWTEIVDLPAEDAAGAGAAGAAPGLVTDGSVAVVTTRLLAEGATRGADGTPDGVTRRGRRARARCAGRSVHQPANQPLGPGLVFW